MTDIVTPDYVYDCLPKASANLITLAGSFITQGSLRALHFYALRDWLEMAEMAPSEPLGALVLLLFQSEEEGSLCLELSQENLRQRLEAIVDELSAATWVASILVELEQADWAALIGDSADSQRPIIRVNSASGSRLYFQKLLRHESRFAESLRERLNAPAKGLAATRLAERGLHARTILAEVLATMPFKLDQDQVQAIELSLTQPFAIISGGPGTGKTALVVTLLRCFARAGMKADRIALAAPTGRAAQRLSGALRSGLAHVDHPAEISLREVQAGTLHQLLDYLPPRNLFRRHIENPIDADLVVVDEVSMVGLTLLSHLFQALAPETRLILLGDKDQLPAVEAGAVLSQLVESAKRPTSSLHDKVAILTQNHRSHPAIRAAAHAVNRQEVESISSLPTSSVTEMRGRDKWAELEALGGCRRVELSTTNELRQLLSAWAERTQGSEEYRSLVDRCVLSGGEADNSSELAELFRLLERHRILTLVRDGPWGCLDVGRFLQRRLHGDKGSLFAGDPVLVTRNDSRRGLYNGDVGVVLRARDGLRVAFAKPDGFVSNPAESLPGYELGYALTVHKSQGSEYDNVLLLFPPEGAGRLLTKELVYTGMTRAKNLALLCGPLAVIRTAVQRRIEREAGALREV